MMLITEMKTILIYILVLTKILEIEAYSNQLYYLVDIRNNTSVGCGAFDNAAGLVTGRNRLAATVTTPRVTIHKNVTDIEDFSFSTLGNTHVKETDPMLGFQAILNRILFGENLESDVKGKSQQYKDTKDTMAMYPSGKVMRAELFHNKAGVHLPRSEWLHHGHAYLNISNADFMQTAVNAFFIFLEGSVDDVLRLPPRYVLRSARTIAMMKIAREKLVATWKVVKGDQRPEEVSYLTLEYYRPLFKYVNGREMARLNLLDDKILTYLGTHADLDRHQVGVIASVYIRKNPEWSTAKYLNLMNNLLCGVPMKFMRLIHESVYLQLSQQIFYHIKACDPLQRRFYLAMMTRTQVLGKSNSWGARDVAKLGLLLGEVEGRDLSAITPDAIAGITPQVMMEMSPRNLKYLTEPQYRYLAQKPLNILTKKMNAYDDEQRVLNNAKKASALSNFIFWFGFAIKLLA